MTGTTPRKKPAAKPVEVKDGPITADQGVAAPERLDAEPEPVKPDAKAKAEPDERRDAPADQEPEVDGASGAIITGEDASGRPLTTEDVVAGEKPVAAGASKRDDDEDKKPRKTTEVTWNGMTAFDTVDGVTQAARPATLAEQLEKHASDILSLVVGTVPYASSGSVEVDGTKLTINLVSH